MVKKIFGEYILFQRLLCLFLTVSLSSNILAAAKHDAISYRLNQLLAAYPEDINIGMVVQDLDSGKRIYARNPKRLFMPASNMKLFTAATALLYLGPDFTYETQLLSDRPLPETNGSLDDNLYLKFDGDPELSIEQIRALFSHLSSAGIKTIQGNLYLDETVFDKNELGPGWMWDDLSFAYAAPIRGAMIAKNSIQLRLQAAAQNGEMSQLTVLNPPVFAQFRNQIITADSKADCKLDVVSDMQNHYVLNGCININHPPICIHLAIRDIHKYVQAVLQYSLDQQQLKLQGNIIFASAKDKSYLLARQHSRPLNELLNTMLKDSDNVIAETLFKTIGKCYYQQPGCWENGSQAMQAILQQELGLDLSTSGNRDGSGISSYNLASPEHFMQLLNHIYHNPAIYPLFLQALPTAGIDGTLKTRLHRQTTRGIVHAKTGTMSGVSALSGYITRKGQHTYAFVILINGFSMPPERYQTLEDQIVSIICTD